MTATPGFRKRTATLAVVGGTAFWVVNLAISLTPIAAEYRAALSISYGPMLLEAAAGGLLIGLAVAYGLLRFFDRIPGRGAIGKAVLLSVVVLVLLTVLIEVPAKFLTPTAGAWRSFVIGAAINLLRIPALGLTIGLLYRWTGRRTQRPVH